MDSFSDPESFRDRVDVPFREETRRLPVDEFDSVTERVESHAVVGITNDEGDVLLMNDGSHGWTLPAFSVAQRTNWLERTRTEAETLLDTSVILEDIELVRRVKFQPETDDTEQFWMYTVIFRAFTNADMDVDKISEETDLSLGWSGSVPDEQKADLASDIRLFLETE